MSELRLAGKVAIVTGAGRGVGRGIALAYARNGADVAGADLITANVESLAEEIRGMGRRALPITADVSVSAQVRGMVRATIDTLGTVDILVNNAALCTTNSLLEVTDEEWDLHFATNVKASFVATSAVAREMIRKKKGGVIINIASPAGHNARPLTVPYGASKAALINFSYTSAVSLAPWGIRVHALLPGLVATEGNVIFNEALAKYIGDDALEGWYDNIPLGRPATPEDIAKVAVFLSSDESAYMSGTEVVVAGGATAGDLTSIVHLNGVRRRLRQDKGFEESLLGD